MKKKRQWETDLKHCNRKHQLTCFSFGKFALFCCNILRTFGNLVNTQLNLTQSQTIAVWEMFFQTSTNLLHAKWNLEVSYSVPSKWNTNRGAPRSTPLVVQELHIVFAGVTASALVLDPTLWYHFKSECVIPGQDFTQQVLQMLHNPCDKQIWCYPSQDLCSFRVNARKILFTTSEDR